MNIKIIGILIFFCMIFSFFACGKEEEESSIFLSGELKIERDDAIGPAFIIITRAGDDIDAVEIEDNIEKYFVEMVRVNPLDNSFYIDLFTTDLKVGEKIMLLAFVDNNFDNGLPYPDEGDILGFYIPEEEERSFRTSYVLKEGINDGIVINVNREVYDFEAKVSGVIEGEHKGDIVIIAYAGEINSFNFDDFDTDGVIGFKKVIKGDGPCSYDLKILPYGFNVPIENIFIIAILDVNKNNKPDAGDLIGFLSGYDNDLPLLLTVNEGIIENKNITFTMEYPESSEYDAPLTGTIEMPVGETYDEDSRPLFLIIANNDDMSALMEKSVDSIKYFEKIEPPTVGSENIDFNVNLYNTDLKAGDKIIIGALWDRDFTAGFLYPTFNDYIGFYIDIDAMSPAYTLGKVENDHITFQINRKVYEFESVVQGSIIGNNAGKITVVAYAGEVNSLDLGKALDFDSIVGYTEVTKDETFTSYSMQILNYGMNVPIENVYLFALFDKNENGVPDGGDLLGYHSTDVNGMPTLVTLNEGLLKNKHIELTMDISVPLEYDKPLSGSFKMPDGLPYDENSNIFLVIMKSGNVGDIMNDMFGTIQYFKKISPSEADNGGAIEFNNIDLSNANLKAGDEIFIAAIWDRDMTVGMPYPTDGDYIGFFLDTEGMSPDYKLKDGAETNDGISFELSRRIYEYEAELNGAIIGSGKDGDTFENDGGKIIVIAFAGEINSFDFATMNFDDAIGYQEVTKLAGETSVSYTLPIMPYGKNAPIEDVLIVAILDKNGDGTPNGGDSVGFYIDLDSLAETGMKLPGRVTINEGTTPNISIEMLMDLPVPSPAAITLSGSIDMPEGESYGADSPPLFALVAKTDNPAAIFNDPLTSIKHFEIIPRPDVSTDTVNFTIDISKTDLAAGDEVVVAAIWDVDYDNRFLNPGVDDYVAYFSNSDDFVFTIQLAEGVNIIPSEGSNEFKLNKKWYNHDSYIKFRFNEGNLEGEWSQGDKIIVVAIQEDGVNFTLPIENSTIDLDYIVGMSIVEIASNTFNGSPFTYYELDIFPFLYEPTVEQPTFGIDKVCVIAIHDANGSGMPDLGERIAYYWVWIFFNIPLYFDIQDGENFPNYMDSRGVWFSPYTSPF